MHNSITFYQLNELFMNLGGLYSPSELQGMLCGQLCGGRQFTATQWQQLALTFMDLEDTTLSEEQAEQLDQLHTMTARLLQDINFRFSPLLPAEESSIRRRTEELGDWCKGFLYGLGASGLDGEATMDANTAEALRDLAQISQVSIDENDEIEENEAYWQELCEYVKVAVLNIYTELNTQDEPDAANPPPSNHATVH